jgi:LuxR family maltose regulon positive regulatory protein
LYQQAVAKAWDDQRLKILLLQALALSAQDVPNQAISLLVEALALAEPSGFIRSFIDGGMPMFQLLSEAATQGIMPAYLTKLLAAFEFETTTTTATEPPPSHQRAKPLATHPQTSIQPAPFAPLSEPLSQRELEVLQLVAQGLSNREISERLFLALITVKGHNQKIFAKLGVQRRTEAVACARQLGLL